MNYRNVFHNRDLMQIYLNTYGTYLHVKDDRFKIRVPVKDAEPEKKHIAAHKI